MTSREDLLKIPKDLMLKQLLFTLLVWFVSSIRNITAFFLQNGKDAISNGQIILGLLFIVLYYVKDPVLKFLDSSIMLRYQVNRNHIKKSAEERSIEVLLEVEENVSYLNPQTRCFEKMEASTITETIGKYLSKIWERSFWLLDSIATLLSSVIVIVGLFKVAHAELEQLTFFVILILFSCMSYVYDVFKRKKIGKKHSEKNVVTRNSQKKMYQNLLNVIPLNDEHAKFLQSNYLKAAEETFEAKKEMTKEKKFIDLFTTSSETVYTVFLLLIILLGKGIDAVNLEMILAIISIAGIYKRFTLTLDEITGKIVTRMNLNNDISAEAENFELIMTAYDSKYKKKQNLVKEIDSIEIYPFKEHHASDERQKKYELWCHENISLYPGDFVILTGPTGAGKSTLMNMITFNRDLVKDCIRVVPETDRYPKTVLQRAKQSLGRQSVLEELTFGNDDYDRKKLYELLHAMNLYEEIAEKTSDVLFYLAHSSKEKFSRGQIQRLVLVRTLLNMEDDVSVVALDEATSNLNDELAIKVMEYVKDFCKSKIVLFATHQTAVLENMANKHLKILETDTEKSYCLTQV